MEAECCNLMHQLEQCKSGSQRQRSGSRMMHPYTVNVPTGTVQWKQNDAALNVCVYWNSAMEAE